GRGDQLGDPRRPGPAVRRSGEPGARAMMARALPSPVPDPGDLEVGITPMRRRHLRSVLRIEAQVYPRPWTFGLFLSEIGQRATRLYVVARVGGGVVGYAGRFQALGGG